MFSIIELTNYAIDMKNIFIHNFVKSKSCFHTYMINVLIFIKLMFQSLYLGETIRLALCTWLNVLGNMNESIETNAELDNA